MFNKVTHVTQTINPFRPREIADGSFFKTRNSFFRFDIFLIQSFLTFFPRRRNKKRIQFQPY